MNRYNFISSFSIRTPFTSFFLINCSGRDIQYYVQWKWWNQTSLLCSWFRGTAFISLPLSMMFTISFSSMALLCWQNFYWFLVCWVFLLWKGVELSSDVFFKINWYDPAHFSPFIFWCVISYWSIFTYWTIFAFQE